MPGYTLVTPHHALTVNKEYTDPSLFTQGSVGDKPWLVTVDTGAYVTVVRPDIAAGWPERQLRQRFKLQAVSGETLPILKEVFLTLTVGWRPIKICVFVANITNELILGLDILRAYDASVDLGRQTLRLAGEEISLWSPGAAKDQVMTAKCEGILMARSESPLEVERSLVKQRLHSHPHADIDIARSSERGRREVPLRTLNALLTHCEPVTLVTPQCNVTNPGMTQSVEKYQEVPKKETTDISVGRLRKRRRGRNLAAFLRQKAKGMSQSRCESTKRATVAGKTTSRSAKLAWLMRDIARSECTGDNVASSNQRGRKCKKRPWIGSECNNGIRDRGLNHKLQGRIGIRDADAILQMCLRIERTSDGIDVKHFRLHNEKRTAESLMALQKMKKWTLWKGRSPSKWKKLQIKKEPAL
jgi:hypothetical protein